MLPHSHTSGCQHGGTSHLQLEHAQKLAMPSLWTGALGAASIKLWRVNCLAGVGGVPLLLVKLAAEARGDTPCQDGRCTVCV